VVVDASRIGNPHAELIGPATNASAFTSPDTRNAVFRLPAPEPRSTEFVTSPALDAARTAVANRFAPSIRVIAAFGETASAIAVATCGETESALPMMMTCESTPPPKMLLAAANASELTVD